MEIESAKYLRKHVDENIIHKRTSGRRDTGDLANLRIYGSRITVEVKNVATMALPAWIREAEVERGNDDGVAGIVIHKKRGSKKMEEQYVTMTLADLVAIINGNRDHLIPEESV